MPMLSGTVRAMLMLCVTIRIVASIWALMSMSNWLNREAVRTGSRPESGSSQRMIRGSSTSERASPARFFIPPEISPGNLLSSPTRPTISSFSMTILRMSLSDFLVCSRSGKAVLSKMFIEPNSAPSWNMTPNNVRIS